MNERILVALAGLLLLAGCSSKQVYDATAGWRGQECRQLRDADERRRCEKGNDRTYEDYRAEAEGRSGRKKPAP